MTALVPIAPQLNKLIPRLGSNFDGEVLATARAIERVLKSAGADWHDLAGAIVPPPPARMVQPSARDWRSLAKFCADRSWMLTEREVDFIVALARYRRTEPSLKQLKWLRDIAERLGVSA